MTTKLELDFDGRPSVAAYMIRALCPGGIRTARPFPPLRARWKGARPDPVRLAQFLRLTGPSVKRGLPVLYPQAFTFPLQMVILTHPASPLPTWKILQVRNRLLQHRPIPPDAALDAEASVAGQRVLDKRLELDIHVTVRVSGEGPVYHGTYVDLAASSEEEGATFALTTTGSSRPALLGRWLEAGTGSRVHGAESRPAVYENAARWVP